MSNLPFTEIKGVKFINLTPHDLHIIRDGHTYTIPKSGQIARVDPQSKNVGSIAEIPITKTTYGAVSNVPNTVDIDGTYFITSTLVAQVVGRKDVLSPDTINGVIRDEKGQIAGVTQLQSFFPGYYA